MIRTSHAEGWLTSIISSLYIFLCLNDTYVVEIFGEDILKNTLLAFAVVNIGSISNFFSQARFKGAFGWLLGIMLLSFGVNWGCLENIQASIYLIIAVLLLFGSFSQTNRPYLYLKVYVASTIFSSILCITATSTISEYTFRRTGGMGDPNEYSLTVLFGIGMVLAQLFSSKSFKKKIGLSLLFAIYVLGLIYAGSKSAFFVLMIVVFVSVYHTLRGLKITKKIQFLSLLLIGMSVLLYFLFEYNKDVVGAFANRFEDAHTGYERLLSWQVGLSLVPDNFLFGIGPENYANIVGLEAPSLAVTSRAAHNMYVQALVELGGFGLLAYMILLFKPVYMYFKKRIDLRCLYPLIALIFMGATLSLLYEKSVWIILALCYNQNLMYNLREKVVK